MEMIFEFWQLLPEGLQIEENGWGIIFPKYQLL